MSGCQKFREFYTIWWTDLGYLASAFCNSAEGTQVDNFPKVKHAQTKGKKASNVYHCIITEKRTIIFSLFTSTLLKQQLSVQANNKYLLKYRVFSFCLNLKYMKIPQYIHIIHINRYTCIYTLLYVACQVKAKKQTPTVYFNHKERAYHHQQHHHHQLRHHLRHHHRWREERNA